MAWLISRMTVAPIKRIARSAEALSQQRLEQRVKVTSRDEIGSLASSFNRMAQRLQDAFESQKRFVSDAAHNLKTPLASMKRRFRRPAKRQEPQDTATLEFVEQDTGAGVLINDLLTAARLTRSAWRRKGPELSKQARETAEVSAACRGKGVAFSERIESGVFIRADLKMIKSLLANLLENALKSTTAGGLACLAVSRNGDEVVIEVSDTGAGIAKEHLPHIFERFYKAPAGDAADGGSGLGLAICRSIVEAHGGKISVQSQSGAGSTFRVALKPAE
jgi:signal transduction histidine kinase